MSSLRLLGLLDKLMRHNDPFFHQFLSSSPLSKSSSLINALLPSSSSSSPSSLSSPESASSLPSSLLDSSLLSRFPLSDIQESNHQFTIHAEIPGVKPDDLSVKVVGDDTIQMCGIINQNNNNENHEKQQQQQNMNESHHANNTSASASASSSSSASVPAASSKWFSHERLLGHFERSFTLPTKIKADQVKATCDNGVLTIEIPKMSNSLAEKVHQVKIQARAQGSSAATSSSSPPYTHHNGSSKDNDGDKSSHHDHDDQQPQQQPQQQQVTNNTVIELNDKNNILPVGKSGVGSRSGYAAGSGSSGYGGLGSSGFVATNEQPNEQPNKTNKNKTNKNKTK